MVILINSFFFFFFLFQPPHSIWSSQARDQIQAAVVTYAAAVAMLDLLTHCAGLGIKPAVLALQRHSCITVGTPTHLFFIKLTTDYKTGTAKCQEKDS